jgi:DUF1680 family protein
VDAVRGSVAVERGPVVYALESIDLPAGWDDVADAVVDASRPPADEEGTVTVRLARRAERDLPWPYGPRDAGAPLETVQVPLVPYHDWAERGPSSMRIWLPTS